MEEDAIGALNALRGRYAVDDWKRLAPSSQTMRGDKAAALARAAAALERASGRDSRARYWEG